MGRGLGMSQSERMQEQRERAGLAFEGRREGDLDFLGRFLDPTEGVSF